MSPRLYVLLTARGAGSCWSSPLWSSCWAAQLEATCIGRDLAYRDLAAARSSIQQLQPEIQRLKKEIIDQNAKLAELQAELTSVQAALDAIMPSENTYNISPNQSLIVAGGHLTLGLIGSPTNQGVNINVNGKQQLAAAGDVINIALDPSTTCQVGVQSFDMFKAVSPHRAQQ